MLGLDGFRTWRRHLSHVVRLRIVQTQRHVLIERRMVSLACSDLSSVLSDEGLGQSLVTAPRIERHEAAPQV
jgi:hypothetical protein